MIPQEIPSLFLSTDEDGFLIDQEKKITNLEIGSGVLANLSLLPNNSFGSWYHDQPVIVEAFDSPLIVQSIERMALPEKNINNLLKLHFHYDYCKFVAVQNLFVDHWDRLHGELENGIPFTFSRKAQEQFFEMLEEYTDEEFEWHGETEKFHPFWLESSAIDSPQWWNHIYENETPGWNLESPAETLKDMLPRLKLPKSKILVLGCGDSHDAAFFASHGHLVTAVDISTHAIERSKKLYGHLDTLKWLEADLFNLPESFHGQFDLIFEYTCYCAINPHRRKELIKVWNQCLHDQGQLMATFFCMHKRQGPPFGSTEWEIREFLKKDFQFLFWGRWKKSIPRRQGRELFVLAKKRIK